MKLKLAMGAVLLCGVSAAADAAPAAAGLNLGGILMPVNSLANAALPALNPLLQPVLSQTGPLVGSLVSSLHPAFLQLTPLFTTVDGVTGALGLPQVKLPGLPGLPQ